LSLGEIAETLGFIKSQCRSADASQVVGAYFLARWAPMIGRDIGAAAEEFGAHICTAHPLVKGIEKPSNAK
jgi:hypothetical protein